MRQAIIYAVLWFVAGVAMGFGIQSVFGVDLALQCGTLNMAAGLVLLLVVLRNEPAYRAFYGEGEKGGLALAILVMLPFVFLFMGVLWWLAGKFLPMP